MKKLLALLLFASCSVVMARDPLTFTQPSGRGTSNDIWVELTKSALEESKVPYRYEVGTCHTSLQAWNRAGTLYPVVMLYSSNWARASLQSGLPCLPHDLDQIKVYAIIKQPWWLCYNTKTSKPMNAPGVKIGYHPPSIPGRDIFADINRNNKFDWKGVPNKGSGESLLMLTNGDVDYAFVAKSFATTKITADSPLKCNLSWKKNDDIPYFLDQVKMTNDPSSMLYFTSMVIGKNLPADMDSLARKIYDQNNPKFAAWMKTLNTTAQTTNDSKKFMREFMDQIRRDMEIFRE